MRGTLILIVGPSGAGKDSLVAAARAKLGDKRFAFPKRVITRSAQDASEDHLFEDTATFEHHEREGAFALSWRAHGLAYGIPRAIEEQLRRGTHVVVNVSRSVIADARERYKPTRVVEVTAPRDVLAARLKARGRETGSQIEARVERSAAVAADVIVINDGPLALAEAAFLRVLSGVESSRQAP